MNTKQKTFYHLPILFRKLASLLPLSIHAPYTRRLVLAQLVQLAQHSHISYARYAMQVPERRLSLVLLAGVLCLCVLVHFVVGLHIFSFPLFYCLLKTFG